MITEEKIRLDLESEKSRRIENSASENVKNFYQKNQEYIEQCYNYYLQYSTSKNKFSNLIRDVEKTNFRNSLDGRIILVLTANPIEEGVLLHGLVDAAKQKLDLYLIDDYAYHVCKLNGYTIVHMHAGKTGEKSTRKTINAAMDNFKPDTIVLLGICYGLDFKKNQLGDVLISSALRNFRLNFRDSEENDETIFEAEEENYKTPSDHLLRTINNLFTYRQTYSCISECNGSIRYVPLHSGTFLSSNSLMSSKKVKEAVIKAFGGAKPKPLGGEMEGGGLLNSKALEELKLDNWFVLKSICDWGEKKNLLDPNPQISEKMKDSIQAMAMVHAWSIFYEMLTQNCLST